MSPPGWCETGAEPPLSEERLLFNPPFTDREGEQETVQARQFGGNDVAEQVPHQLGKQSAYQTEQEATHHVQRPVHTQIDTGPGDASRHD